MWFAHFECVIAAENARRYYRYEIEQGLFGAWHLTARWGRIGSPGRQRQIACGETPESIWTILSAEARQRFRHGYALATLELPTVVRGEIEAMRPRLTQPGQVDSLRANVLVRTRALLRQLPKSGEQITEIDRLIDRIDPERRRARRNVRRGRPRPLPADLLGTFVPEAALAPACSPLESAEVEVRRELFRLLSAELLADDPAVARGVLRCLELPKPFEPDPANVVSLRRANDRIESWTVDQFVRDAFLRRRDPPRPDFHYLTPELATRLREAGCRRVSDLIAADFEALTCAQIISTEEVGALSRACADYDLRLRRHPAQAAAPVMDVA